MVCEKDNDEDEEEDAGLFIIFHRCSGPRFSPRVATGVEIPAK